MREGCRERNETIERGKYTDGKKKHQKTLFFLMLIFEFFYQLLYWGECPPPKHTQKNPTYVYSLVPVTFECDLMWKGVIANVIK